MEATAVLTSERLAPIMLLPRAEFSGPQGKRAHKLIYLFSRPPTKASPKSKALFRRWGRCRF